MYCQVWSEPHFLITWQLANSCIQMVCEDTALWQLNFFKCKKTWSQTWLFYCGPRASVRIACRIHIKPVTRVIYLWIVTDTSHTLALINVFNNIGCRDIKKRITENISGNWRHCVTQFLKYYNIVDHKSVRMFMVVIVEVTRIHLTLQAEISHISARMVYAILI